MLKKLEDIINNLKISEKIKLVVAAAQDKEVLHAVLDATIMNIIEPILVGDINKIKEIAKQLKFSLENIELINADSYEEAAAIKQIESLIKAKDFKALKELGIEVYDKQSLKALEQQIGEWEMRNFERMNKIWKNTSRTLDKIQITKNNLQSAAEILGIAGTTAGTIIVGMQKGHELKDKRYNDRISYYERNLIPYKTKEEIKNIEREKSAKKEKKG